MKRVSVELVPRDEASLREALGLVAPYREQIDVINIPDLLRMPMRSWEGAPPQDMMHEVYPTTTTDVIRKFREEMPEVKVYAGIDQYRSSMAQERYRIQRKVQAGAAGFFTQPFYDMRYLEMYADMLTGLEVYWGVSPVMTRRSQSYWERKNHVVFPRSFAPTLDWSVEFTREVMAFADKNDASLYVMPIKTNLEAYLAGIFA